ncbi:MAG: hypothetical protein OXF41_18845 [bacterium]|nr:hypothetical protein [Acidimicrobiia bacterium]MCY4371425.1 hypothetical protein [bacterium]
MAVRKPRASGQDITLGDFHKTRAKMLEMWTSSSVRDTIDYMDHHNIDQVLVIDSPSDDRWMMVTRRMIAAAQLSDPEGTPVRALLDSNQDPRHYLPAATPLYNAAPDLIKYDWVITTRDGERVGFATVGDALEKALKALYG